MLQRHFANCITAARVPLSLSLLLVKPLSASFIAIYLLCGFSDVLDGYIARRTNTQSALGSRFDSAADFVMTSVILIVLYPIVAPPTGILLWIAGIAAVRFAAAALVWVKYGKPAMLHTVANKITGIMLFLFPLLLVMFSPEAPVLVLCCIATFSAVEELLLDILSESLDTDRKSIFILCTK